jgi:hypothetical protein
LYYVTLGNVTLGNVTLGNDMLGNVTLGKVTQRITPWETTESDCFATGVLSCWA